MALLSIENLTVGYEGEAVLDNISFSIDKGDYLCIVGENGSGKTTLMKTMLGLIPPIKGQIKHGDGLKKNEIGYLPQQTVVQKDFPASVREIVLSGCQNRSRFIPFYTKEDKQLAAEKLKELDITDLSGRCYRDLSGGQQQRVLLARALCATGKLLVLDEPVAGLDPVVTAEMYDLISVLNRKGIAVIMISHDLNMALEYASHILHIGNDVFFGTKEEYMNSNIGIQFIQNDNFINDNFAAKGGEQ